MLKNTVEYMFLVRSKICCKAVVLSEWWTLHTVSLSYFLSKKWSVLWYGTFLPDTLPEIFSNEVFFFVKHVMFRNLTFLYGLDNAEVTKLLLKIYF